MAPFSSFSAFLQPASAWSKNGLLVFFGTSAKVYFLSAALGPPIAAAITPAAAVAANRYFSIALPSLVILLFCTRYSSPRSITPLTPNSLKQDRENDEAADEHALPVGIDASHQKCIPDHFNQRRSDHGAECATFAAHKVG